MDADVWAVVLLLLGLALLVGEVFIPSGGLIGAAAGLTLLVGLICAGNAWWTAHPSYFWIYLGGLALLFPVTLGVAFAVWPHTPMGRRAILQAPTASEVASFVEEEQLYQSMVGKVGHTETLLNPAGIVRIDGHRVHCQSEGMIVEPQVKVRVLSSQGSRVLVRVLAPDEPDVPPPLPTDPGTRPVDFDLA